MPYHLAFSFSFFFFLTSLWSLKSNTTINSRKTVLLIYRQVCWKSFTETSISMYESVWRRRYSFKSVIFICKSIIEITSVIQNYKPLSEKNSWKDDRHDIHSFTWNSSYYANHFGTKKTVKHSKFESKISRTDFTSLCHFVLRTSSVSTAWIKVTWLGLEIWQEIGIRIVEIYSAALGYYNCITT